MPISKEVNKSFFKKWTPEMAYVLGFLYADGTITKNSRGAEYVVLQIKDKELLEVIRETLQSNHKIAQRVHKKDHSVFYRLQIGSKEICSDLRKLGIIERKTHRLKMPSIPPRHIGGFVRGYFDGDGHVWMGEIHKRRKRSSTVVLVGFTSGCKPFLYALHKKLVKKGLLGGSLICKKRGFCLQYSVRDSLRLYEIMYARLDSDLFLERKKSIFDKFIKVRNNAVVA